MTPKNNVKRATTDISLKMDYSSVSDSTLQPRPTTNSDLDMARSGPIQCGLSNLDHVDNHNVNDVVELDYAYKARRTQKGNSKAAGSNDNWSYPSTSNVNFKYTNDVTTDSSTNKVADKVLLDDGYMPLQNNTDVQHHRGTNNETRVKESKVFSLSHNNDIAAPTTCYEIEPCQKSSIQENAVSPNDARNRADFHQWHRQRGGSEKAHSPLEVSDSFLTRSGADIRKWQSEHLEHHVRPLSTADGHIPVWNMQQGTNKGVWHAMFSFAYCTWLVYLLNMPKIHRSHL